MCRFGPDARGNYIDNVLPMTEYILLCKGNEGFCQCDQDSIYSLHDGQLESVNSQGGTKSETTIFVGGDGETATAAILIAGCAICLVAISLILLLLYVMMKRGNEKIGLENKEEEQIIRNYRKQQSMR